MKVIDLLNKIANGKELPKKIILYGDEYKLSDELFGGMCFKYFYVSEYGNWCNVNLGLNDEIEIIEPVVEEDKSTPNHPVSISEQFENLGYAINKAQKCFAKGWNTANEEEKTIEKIEYYDDSIAWVIDCAGQLSDIDKIAIDKINELIDEINKLKEQK